ncbi:MAG TPA: TetR/AcrR family transcriptional regulator [Rubrivivax sp.]|nr:TetR/AcrR family transcriptional regulator [Rubrivivax sp.]
MGHSQADKADSRERILKQAAEQIRDAGLESLSVGPLMRSVNLTHGGFYGHFASRSELLAQALERALQDGAAASMAAIGATPDYPKLLRSYLSRKHRDMRRNGCAIAALASDVARADEASREVMSQHIEHVVQRLAPAMGTQDRERALFAVSAMIGALLVSRVLTDPAKSDALLAEAREQLAALAAEADSHPVA